MIDVEYALAKGRRAVEILQAEPHDLDHGYDKDEVAEQYAAVDRLVEAFRVLDRHLTELPQVVVR